MSTTPRTKTSPASSGAANTGAEDVVTNHPTTQLTGDSAMNIPTITPDTAWLGEYADELTAEQIATLNYSRNELQSGAGFSEETDRVLRSDALIEVGHNRRQAAMAGVPLPSWAPDAGLGWELWNDGKLRRSHDLATWPSIRPTLNMGGAFGVFVGGCEVQDSPPEIYVDVYAVNVRLTPAEARQAAQQLLDAADKADEVAQ